MRTCRREGVALRSGFVDFIAGADVRRANCRSCVRLPPDEGTAMPNFTLNGSAVTVDLPADMPLLWALRDVVGVTGTKFGCGVGACGACTVHLDGQPIRSCLTPLSAVEGKPVAAIEAMEQDPVGKRVQAA